MHKRLTLMLLVAAFSAFALVASACSSESTDEPVATAGAAMTTAAAAAADSHDEGADLTDAAVAQSLTIEMRDFAFVPASLEINAGDVVEIAFKNDGAVTHDFTIEHADMDWMMVGEMEMVAGHSGDEHMAGLAMHVPLEGSHNGTARMRVHEPGEYVFYCTVAGHRELGMEGTLTVR